MAVVLPERRMPAELPGGGLSVSTAFTEPSQPCVLLVALRIRRTRSLPVEPRGFTSGALQQRKEQTMRGLIRARARWLGLAGALATFAAFALHAPASAPSNAITARR